MTVEGDSTAVLDFFMQKSQSEHCAVDLGVEGFDDDQYGVSVLLLVPAPQRSSSCRNHSPCLNQNQRSARISCLTRCLISGRNTRVAYSRVSDDYVRYRPPDQ